MIIIIIVIIADVGKRQDSAVTRQWEQLHGNAKRALGIIIPYQSERYPQYRN